MPKAVLFEEFQKIANIYFAVIVVLQIVPSTTNTQSIPTVLPVLIIIIAFDSILKGLQDKKRHAADRAANHAQCSKLVDGQFAPSVWTEVIVGDFLYITNYEKIPADVVIVAAYEPDPLNPKGACHVETKSLDGETNLKGRAAPRMLALRAGGALEEQTAACGKITGHMECEQPNAATATFVGKVQRPYPPELRPPPCVEADTLYVLLSLTLYYSMCCSPYAFTRLSPILTLRSATRPLRRR